MRAPFGMWFVIEDMEQWHTLGPYGLEVMRARLGAQVLAAAIDPDVLELTSIERPNVPRYTSFADIASHYYLNASASNVSKT